MLDPVRRGKIPKWFRERVRRRFLLSKDRVSSWWYPESGFGGVFPHFDHVGTLDSCFINEPYEYQTPEVMDREALTTALLLGLDVSKNRPTWNSGCVQYRFCETPSEPYIPRKGAKYFVRFTRGAALTYVGRIVGEPSWDTYAVDLANMIHGYFDNEIRIFRRSDVVVRFNTLEDCAEAYDAITLRIPKVKL